METKANHTPGPWVYDMKSGEIRTKEETIGRFHTGREDAGNDMRPLKANARLIALAPNLLEFVRHFSGDCMNEPGEYPETGESGKAPCVACRANSLIAQVNGR